MPIPTNLEFPVIFPNKTETAILDSLLDDVHDDFYKGEGDFVHDMLAPPAAALAEFYAAFPGWLASAFPSTATGDALDIVASAWGLSRNTGETDGNFRARLLARVESPIGGGTVADWKTWTLSFPDVEIVAVTVIPAASGAGTVTIQAAKDDEGAKVALTPGEIDALEAYLADYTPAGVVLTVSTITTQSIDVAATVEAIPGTAASVEANLVAVIEEWILSTDIGGELVRMELAQRLMDVPGAYDITTLTIDEDTDNVDLASGVSAEVGTVTATPTTWTPG